MSKYEYSYTPRARIWTSFMAAGLFFACSMSFSAIGMTSSIRELFFSTAFLTLVISLLIVKRFIAVGYSYAFFRDVSDGRADMVICEHSRLKREPVVACRVSVYDIRTIEEYGRSKADKKRARSAKKKRRGGRFYDYCAEPFPREYCIIRLSDAGEDVYVKFTPDVRLKEIIKSAML